MDWTLHQLCDFMFIHPGGVVYDRFTCLEDMVYGPILRSGSHFQLDEPLLNILKSFNPLIIYTRIDTDKIFNFGDRDQYPGVIANKVALLHQFDELMVRLMARGWRVEVYDYTQYTL
jgi:hypothetical protein